MSPITQLDKANINKDIIIKKYEDGVTVKNIARDVGIDRSVLRKILVEWGVHISKPVEKLLRQHKEEIINDRCSGMSRQQISDKWGVSESTISKYLVEWGYSKESKIANKDKVMELYKEGKSPMEITKIMQTSKTTIYKILQMNGFKSTDSAEKEPTTTNKSNRFIEGESYIINSKQYIFDYVFKAAVPLWMFIGPWGRYESFTKEQLQDGLCE